MLENQIKINSIHSYYLSNFNFNIFFIFTYF